VAWSWDANETELDGCQGDLWHSLHGGIGICRLAIIAIGQVVSISGSAWFRMYLGVSAAQDSLCSSPAISNADMADLDRIYCFGIAVMGETQFWEMRSDFGTAHLA
jgi:hypothetical protein